MKGVIFDIDGVILDSMAVWERAGEMFLKGLGLQPEPGLAETMFWMSMAEGAQYLKERYQLDLDERGIIQGINQTIADFYAHQVQLKDGVALFLKGLQHHGIPMVAATSCDREVFEPALVRLNVMGYFDRIFTATEVGVGKTKPEIYLVAAEHMGTQPKDTWVFEDALYAIKTAKAAGFKAVGVYDPSGEKDWHEIKALCDLPLETLEDIHGFLKRV